jgi:hypothetical protein
VFAGGLVGFAVGRVVGFAVGLGVGVLVGVKVWTTELGSVTLPAVGVVTFPPVAPHAARTTAAKTKEAPRDASNARFIGFTAFPIPLIRGRA